MQKTPVKCTKVFFSTCIWNNSLSLYCFENTVIVENKILILVSWAKMIHGLSVVFSKTFVDTSTEVNGVFLWLDRDLNISLFVNWLTPAKKRRRRKPIKLSKLITWLPSRLTQNFFPRASFHSGKKVWRDNMLRKLPSIKERKRA